MSKKDVLENNKVYMVPADGGTITTCYLQACLDDCVGEIFTKEAIEASLESGEAVFSDDFYYATNREALAKFDKSEAVEPETENTEVEGDIGITISESEPETVAEPEQAERRVGDVMKHSKKGHLGEIIETKDGLRIQYFTTNKAGDRVEVLDAVSSKWQEASASEFFEYQDSKSTDIATVTPQEIIEAEPVLEDTPEPLSAKEEKKLAKLEEEFEKVDGLERAIPFEKGRILNEIRQGNLYRATHKTFGDYAFERFGITREYAQNLAQIAGIPDLAKGLLEGGAEVNMSVNAANELMRDSNKVMRSLGIGKVEFDLVAPVMRQTLALMVDVAPKDSQGNVELTPKFITSFNSVLASHLTDGTIEIDGKQMSLKAAHEQGLLNPALRSEVLESAAEAVKANAQTIRDEYKSAVKRQEEGVLNGGGAGSELPDTTKYYKGKKPVLTIVCSLHEDTEVTSIGNGRFQTRCGCRWLMDAESGELVAYEVNDLPVKR